MTKTTDVGRPGEHSDIDTAAVARRTATRQVEQQDRLDRIEPIVMVIDARTQRMSQQLDVIVDALRPRMSPGMQAVVAGAVVVASIALVVIAFGVVSVVRTPTAHASVEVVHR